MIKNKISVGLIGTGNVAKTLGKLIYQNGFKIDGVLSRNFEQSKLLAESLGASTFISIDEFKADVILLCISDDEVLKFLKNYKTNKFIAYTSGTVQLNNFHGNDNIGVFYPLQTFTRDFDLKNKDFPILIEANNDKLHSILNEIGNIISKNVIEVNSKERLEYHLSAVMINNFTNHLHFLAKERLKKIHLNPDLLDPLWKETLDKLEELNPKEAQTGPARRADLNTIQTHMTLLNHREKQIYNSLTNSIFKTYSDEKL